MNYNPDQYWNERYKTYKNVGHSDVDYYKYEESIRFKIFRRLIHIKPGLKMLDVGCGDGVWAICNAKDKAEVTAIDISEECIKAAEEKNNLESVKVQFKVSKAEDIDFPEQNFDVVYSITVLQHIPTQEKLEQAVYKIVHAVKKEGYILIGIGVLMMFITVLIYSNIISFGEFTKSIIIIITEPAGWFLFWIGGEKLVYEKKEKMPDLDFYKKMSIVEIVFHSY